jgi:hypothetical protein
VGDDGFAFAIGGDSDSQGNCVSVLLILVLMQRSGVMVIKQGSW